MGRTYLGPEKGNLINIEKEDKFIESKSLFRATWGCCSGPRCYLLVGLSSLPICGAYEGATIIYFSPL